VTSAALRHSIVSDTAVMMPACSSTPSIDLIELNGDDLRRDPLVVREATLASVLAKTAVAFRCATKVAPSSLNGLPPAM
jgi:ATP-dependent DNA ligase